MAQPADFACILGMSPLLLPDLGRAGDGGMVPA
jgi:hypothetical protein